MTDEAQAPVLTDNASPPAAPAQITAPAPAPADWRASLPEDIRGHKSLEKFTSQEALAASYLNLERTLGMEKVPRPKGEFDPSNPDWQAFLDAAGRPKEPTEYKFGEVKMPEGLTYDGGLEDKFRSVFHTAGLNPKQAELMRDAFVAHQVEAYQASMTEIENDTAARREAMKKELGTAYDGYVNAATVAQKEFLPETLLAKIEAAGLAKDPDWTMALGKIGKAMIGEDKLKAAGVSDMTTPSDYQKAALDFQSKNAHILYTHGHPDQARVNAEYTALMQKAYPDG